MTISSPAHAHPDIVNAATYVEALLDPAWRDGLEQNQYQDSLVLVEVLASMTHSVMVLDGLEQGHYGESTHSWVSLSLVSVLKFGIAHTGHAKRECFRQACV